MVGVIVRVRGVDIALGIVSYCLMMIAYIDEWFDEFSSCVNGYVNGRGYLGYCGNC